MENLIGSDDNLDEFQIDCSEYRRCCAPLTGGCAHVGFKFQVDGSTVHFLPARAPSGSAVSKTRLIRRVSTACVIGELLKEFISLVSEVTTSLVRERHEVVAHGESGIVPVVVLLDGTSVGGVWMDFKSDQLKLFGTTFVSPPPWYFLFFPDEMAAWSQRGPVVWQRLFTRPSSTWRLTPFVIPRALSTGGLSRAQAASVLGVDASLTDPSLLKKAFIQRAKAVHPDVSHKPVEESKVEFRQALQAFDTLMQTEPAKPPARGGVKSTVKWEATWAHEPSRASGVGDNLGDDPFRVFRERRSEGATRRRVRERNTSASSGGARGWKTTSQADMVFHRSHALSFLDLSWWANLETELGDALDFAYWGPKFEGAGDQWPYEWEAEERNHDLNASATTNTTEETELSSSSRPVAPALIDPGVAVVAAANAQRGGPHPHILALVSGRQELGYVQEVSDAAQLSPGNDQRSGGSLPPPPPPDRSSPPLPRPSLPTLELVYRGRRIATAFCRCATSDDGGGGRRGDDRRVIEVYGYRNDNASDGSSSKSSKSSSSEEQGKGGGGGGGGGGLQGARLLGSIEGPYDEFAGACRYRVLNGRGDLHGHVMIIRTPGVETCSWLVCAASNGGRDDAPFPPPPSPPPHQKKQQQLYDRATGRPLVECRSTRAWLPPEEFWLWGARAATHAGSSVYFEVPREGSRLGASTSSGIYPDDDEGDEGAGAAGGRRSAAGHECPEAEKQGQRRRKEFINLCDFFEDESVRDELMALKGGRGQKQSKPPLKTHERMHPAVFVLFTAFRTLAREEELAERHRRKNQGGGPFSGIWRP